VKGRKPVRRAAFFGFRNWYSNDERTLQSAELTASSLLSFLAASLHLPTVDTCWAKKGLHRDAILHSSSNRFFILKLSMTGPATGDGFHPESTGKVSDARRMEGGVAGLR
jgi:hypothetical protein